MLLRLTILRKETNMDFEEFKAYSKELEEMVYIDDADCICFRDGNAYQVPINNLKDERAILAWTLHLSEKTWMTTTALRRFMSLACQPAGIKRPTV